MKKAVLYSLLVLLCLLLFECGTLPKVEIDCNGPFGEKIYTNAGKNKIDVTVQAKDECEGDSSVITQYEYVDYDPSPRPVAWDTIPDGKTTTITFTVGPGGFIVFTCKGEEGGCSYTISVP